jgi:hypothetical protein
MAASPKLLLGSFVREDRSDFLEWVAYHRAVGVSDIHVFTDHKTKGNRPLLDALEAGGAISLHPVRMDPDLDEEDRNSALRFAEIEARERRWLRALPFTQRISADQRQIEVHPVDDAQQWRGRCAEPAGQGAGFRHADRASSGGGDADRAPARKAAVQRSWRRANCAASRVLVCSARARPRCRQHP